MPIAGISTGTNNAFPDHREPTITGLAVGLAVTGRVPAEVAFHDNKRIDVSINDGAVREIALVDVALVTEGYVGARALWRTETFRELFVTFADPEVIGMSAIAGLLEPVGRSESGGLMVRMGPLAQSPVVVRAPIGPGLVASVGIKDWRRMSDGVPIVPGVPAGSIALDGERELSFSERDSVVLTLRDRAFRTVNVSGAMHYAAAKGSYAAPMRCSMRPNDQQGGGTMANNPFPLSQGGTAQGLSHDADDPRVRGASACRVRQGRYSRLRASLCR